MRLSKAAVGNVKYSFDIPNCSFSLFCTNLIGKYTPMYTRIGINWKLYQTPWMLKNLCLCTEKRGTSTAWRMEKEVKKKEISTISLHVRKYLGLFFLLFLDFLSLYLYANTSREDSFSFTWSLLFSLALFFVLLLCFKSEWVLTVGDIVVTKLNGRWGNCCTLPEKVFIWGFIYNVKFWYLIQGFNV